MSGLKKTHQSIFKTYGHHPISIQHAHTYYCYRSQNKSNKWSNQRKRFFSSSGIDVYALCWCSLHSSPGWSMMEQHSDIICHFPPSLPCWYSDRACHPPDYLFVTTVWLKQLAYRRKYMFKKNGDSVIFVFIFQFLAMITKWPTLHKSCLLQMWKAIVQKLLTCIHPSSVWAGCLGVHFWLCS